MQFVDDEEEGMQPLKLHFPSSQYQKSLKLSGKCYIDTAISNIQTILKEKEVEWFIEHPQFQHLFHIKNQRKNGWECGFLFCDQPVLRRSMSYGLSLMASQSDTLSENLDSFLDYTAMSIPQP